VKIRNRDELQILVERSCKRGTKVYTDGWLPYKGIAWHAIGMEHKENLRLNEHGDKVRTMFDQ